MYKVVLVDDEEIEREAMAEIIPWKKLDMELIDVAWNGVEGLSKIRQNVPDIVITDIKMPVMNGIELIRETKALYPDIVFIVLSGYGEYEYTSKAMELGIRHYIIKPCDEDKIVETLLNIKNELFNQAEKRKSENEFQSSIKRILPHLKERILYELIAKKELSLSDQVLLSNFTADAEDNFVLLSVRSPQEFNQLDRFTLTNILTELLGENRMYMSAAFRKEMVYLIPAILVDHLTQLMLKLHEEYFKYNQVQLFSAVSKNGKLEECSQLYCQIQELFYFGSVELQQKILRYDMYDEENEAFPMIVNYTGIREAKSYEELMFEVYCACAKMQLRGLSQERIWEIYNFALKILFGEDVKEIKYENDIWNILENVIEQCAFHMNLMMPDTKDGNRLKEMLYAIYKNIKNPELNLQYLAQNILFMNEDYVGRFFTRCMNEKYSSFLIKLRIMLVQRFLAFLPELKMEELTEQIGYPADGQYLTKVFKKQTGILLSDYRKRVKEKES